MSNNSSTLGKKLVAKPGGGGTQSRLDLMILEENFFEEVDRDQLDRTIQ